MHIKLSKEELNTKFGIYAIRNIVSGKVYIGQTQLPFKSRIKDHIYALSKGWDSRHLQSSFNKHGDDAFEIVMQECCNETENILHWLNEREMFWIRYYRNILGRDHVFNLNDGGNGPNPSEESRQMQSHAMKLEWNRNREARVKKNQETNKRTSSRKKNSESQKKRWQDPETHEHLTNVARRCFSNKEHGKKTSKINKERWQDDEVKRKHRESTERHWSTQEAHNKRKIQMLRMWANPENRNKRLEIEKERKRKRDYVVDCILHNAYLDYPHLQNLCRSKKLYLIYRIARLHS